MGQLRALAVVGAIIVMVAVPADREGCDTGPSAPSVPLPGPTFSGPNPLQSSTPNPLAPTPLPSGFTPLSLGAPLAGWRQVRWPDG
jgi:hypothetical protein